MLKVEVGGVRIELLVIDDCPNHEAFRPHLERLLERSGVRDPVIVRRIGSVEEAAALRFLGSPTLRIDGVDVDPSVRAAPAPRADQPLGDTGPAGEAAFGLQCRLYRTPDGLRGTPPDEWVVAALQRAAASDAGAVVAEGT